MNEEIEKLKQELEIERQKTKISLILANEGFEELPTALKAFLSENKIEQLSDSNLVESVKKWKSTDLGNVFLKKEPLQINKVESKAKRSAKEISKGLKDGSLKLKLS